ncbi:hypothetical protein [Nocardiopsis composta]|uniref:hypothetical protein n=1 Tax=Nocardiopsis composta TaxID=157465 RepID=UPI0031D73230
MDISALAMEGASVLVQAMASDLWQGVRPRFAALFGKRGDDVAEELEQVNAEIEDGEATREDIEQEWAARLRRVLKADPEAARVLQAIIDEVAPQQERTVYSSVNVINSEVSGTAVQIGHVHGTSRGADLGGMRGVRALGDALGGRYDRDPRSHRGE